MKKNLKHIKKIDSIQDEPLEVKKCFSTMKMLAVHPNIVAIENDNTPISERNYILSLVYNMGKADYIRNHTEYSFFQKPCFVGGETSKEFQLEENEIKYTCEQLGYTIKENKIKVFPDLLIHNSHSKEAIDTGNQLLALEAKTSKRLGEEAFYRDFFKLNLYIDILHYENVVFLVINKSAKEIDDLIGKYINKKYYLSTFCWKSKLYLFIQENNTPELFKPL